MKKLIAYLFFLLPLITAAQDKVLLLFENGKWGATDSLSKTILPCKYNNINILNDFLAVQNNPYFGLFNLKGEKILDFQFDSIQLLSNQYFTVSKNGFSQIFNTKAKKFSTQLKKNQLKILEFGKYALKLSDTIIIYNTIDNKELNIIADTLEYLAIRDNQTNGYTMASFLENKDAEYHIIKLKGKKGLLNKDFEIVLPAKYEAIIKENNYFRVIQNNKIGLTSFEGKELIPCIYDEIKIQNPYISVKKDNLYGHYTSDFKLLIDVKYDYIHATNFEFIIVSKNNYKGAFDSQGKVIFNPNEFTDLEPINNGFLLFSKNGRNGLISRNGKIIFDKEFDNIYYADKLGFTFSNKGKMGFLDFSGNIIIKPEFDYIEKINATHLKVRNKNKYGIINVQGKGVIPVEYTFLSPTPHDHIFNIRTVNYEFMSGKDIQDRVGAPLSAGWDLREGKEFKWGLINTNEQILLDTIYYRPQIVFDEDNFAAKIIQDSTVLIVSFDDKGNLIDKVEYANFITFRVNAKVNSFFWKQDPSANSDAWGLLSSSGTNITGFQYSKINQNYNNDSALVLTERRFNNSIISAEIKKEDKLIKIQTKKIPVRLGIVNQKLGEEFLICRYVSINTDDFQYAAVARCLSANSDFHLIDKTFKPLSKKYTYIDDFQDSIARYCINGKYALSMGETYNIYTPNFKKQGMEALTNDMGYNLQIFEGTWGVLDNSGTIIIPAKYQFLQKYYKNEFIAKLKDKWGVIYSNDSVKVPFVFDEIRYFNNELDKNQWADADLYKIRIGKVWGVSDEWGNILIEPQYEDIKLLNDAENLYFGVKNSNLWGVISLKNEKIVPIKYSSVEYLSNKSTEYFLVRNTGELFGFLNEKGELANNEFYQKARSFKNNFAAIELKNDFWNFIDKNSKVISNGNFTEVADFYEDRAVVRTNGGFAFINTSGEIMTNQRFFNISNFSYQRAIFTKKMKKKNIKKDGIIDNNGKIVLKAKYQQIKPFSHSVALFYGKKGKGLLSIDGKVILKPQYTTISEFSKEGLAIISDNKRKKAVIDSTGKIIVPFGKYSEIEEFSCGMALVNQNGLYGFINSKGEEVFKPQFKNANSFKEDMAAVKTNKTWGFINKEKIIIKETFKKIGDFKDGYAFVIDNSNKGIFIDKKGNGTTIRTLKQMHNGFYMQKRSNNKVVFLNEKEENSFLMDFDDAENFVNGKAIVKNKKYGILNTKGEYFVLPFLDYVEQFSEERALFKINEILGLYNNKGEELLKTKYLNIKDVGSTKIQVSDFNKIFYLEKE